MLRPSDLNPFAVSLCFPFLFSAPVLALDLDSDGISDIVESRLARDLNPASDSDNDGLTDGFEARWSRQPFNGQDGILPWTGTERAGAVDVHCETVPGCRYQVQTSLNNGPWTDAGPQHTGTGRPFTYELSTAPGITWRVEVSDGLDEDGDGLLTREEILLGSDPLQSDTDGDGLSDGQEAAWLMHPLDPDEDRNGIPDGGDDFDGDSQTNAQEAAAGTPAVAAPGLVRPAVWIEPVGTAALYPVAAGSTLTKTLTTTGWNASAAARQDLLGNGAFRFTATASNKAVMAGWEANTPGSFPPGTAIAFARLSHAFYLRTTGIADVYENGASKGIAVPFTAGARFEVRRTGGEVSYWKDDTLVYTSLTASAGRVRPSVSMYSSGSSLTNVSVSGIGDTDLDADGLLDECEGRIRFAADDDGLTTLATVAPGDDFDGDGVSNGRECADGTSPADAVDAGSNTIWRFFTGLTGTAPSSDSGTTLQKFAAGLAWDTAAMSRQEWCCDGLISWKFGTGDAMVGFSTSQQAPSGTISVDWAIMGRAKKAYVYEGGVLKFTGATWTPGDRFAVERVGGGVRYLKNGNIFYWSRNVAEGPLRGDALIYTSGGTVTECRVSGTHALDIDTDDDGMRDSVEDRIIIASDTDAYAALADVAPSDDFDGDGVINAHEELDGSDPADAASAFRAVNWLNIAGAESINEPPGTTLRKTGTTTAWDASALSREQLVTDGCIRFSFDLALKNAAVGLYAGRTGTGVTPLEYSVYVKTNGYAYAYQSSTLLGEIGRADPSAVFEIERSGATITWRRNGIAEWTVQNGSTASMQVMAALSSVGSEASRVRVFGLMDPDTDGDGLADEWEQVIIAHDPADAFTSLASVTAAGDADDDGVSNLREFTEGSDPLAPGDWFQPVQWTQFVNTAAGAAGPDGSSVQKTGTVAAWDATAWSTEVLTGSGAVQFRADPDNVNAWVHLRDPAAAASAPSLCSLRIRNNRTAALYAGSLQSGTAVAFTRTDTLELRREGNTVSFWKNKRQLASATVTATPTVLKVYAQFHTVAAVLTAARTRGFRGTTWDFDGDSLSDEWELTRLGRISLGAGDDPDGDSLPNADEFAAGSDPLDFFNGTAPQLALLSAADHTATVSEFLPDPVVIEVRSAAGTPLANAPVIFTVEAGGGGVALSAGGPTAATRSLRTGPDGRAQVWFQAGSASGITCILGVTAASARVEVRVLTTPSHNAPPVLTVTTPQNGTRFAAGAPVPFSLTSSDPDGSVASVQFFLRGASIGAAVHVGGDAWSFTWSGALPGTQSVVARATDNRGRQSFASVVVRIDAPASEGEALGDIVGGLHLEVPGGSTFSLSAPLARPLVYSGKINARNGARLALTGAPEWNASRFADGGHVLAFAGGALVGSWIPVAASGADWVEVEDASWIAAVVPGDPVRILPAWKLDTLLPGGAPAVAAATAAGATRVTRAAEAAGNADALWLSTGGWLTAADAPVAADADWLLPGDAVTLWQPAGPALAWQPVGEAVSWASLALVDRSLSGPGSTFTGALALHPLAMEETTLTLDTAADGAPPDEWVTLLPWPGENAHDVWREGGLWRDAAGPLSGQQLLPGRALLIRRSPGSGPFPWYRWSSFSKHHPLF